MVLSAFPQTAHANLLDNPGFENWTMYEGTEVPVNWMHIFNFPSPTGVKDSSVVKSGSYSAKIFTTPGYSVYSPWGGWFQERPFTAGQTLYAYQPVNIPLYLSNDMATLQITFKNSSGNVIGSKHVATRTTSTNGTWQVLTWSGIAPAGTVKFEYGVMMETCYNFPDYGTQEIIYYDNAYADNVPIPEPTSLLLLGVGLIGMITVTKSKM